MGGKLQGKGSFTAPRTRSNAHYFSGPDIPAKLVKIAKPESYIILSPFPVLDYTVLYFCFAFLCSVFEQWTRIVAGFSQCAGYCCFRYVGKFNTCLCFVLRRVKSDR